MSVRTYFALALIAFGSAHASIADAAIRPEEWKNHASFSAPLEYGSPWYVAEIPASVKDTGSLRIINGNGDEVPFALVLQNAVVASTSSRTASSPARILENTLVQYQGKEERVIVLDTGKEGQVYTGIDLVQAPDLRNFRKTVHIYVSDTALGASSASWKELEEKRTVYSFSNGEGFKAENLHVRLSSVFSRYIKLQFESAYASPENTFNALAADVQYVNSEVAGTTVGQYVAGNFDFGNAESLTVDADRIDAQTLIVQNNAARVTGLELLLDKDSQDFIADVSVEVSKDGSGWERFATSTVYRLNDPAFSGEKLTIELPKVIESPSIRLTIRSRKEAAFAVLPRVGLRVQKRAVLFTAKGTDVERYMLLSDNPSATSTTYNLGKQLADGATKVPTRLKVVGSTGGSLNETSDWDIVRVILVVALLLAGLGAYRKFRHIS